MDPTTLYGEEMVISEMEKLILDCKGFQMTGQDLPLKHVSR